MCPAHFHIYQNPQGLPLDYIFTETSQKLPSREEGHTRKNKLKKKKGVLNSMYTMMNSGSSFLRGPRIYPTH